MNFKDYTIAALRTESTLSPLSKEVEDRGLTNRIYHAILGINTEINEIYDAVELTNCSSWDKVNIAEEIGDAFWYIAILAEEIKEVEEIDINFETIEYCNESTSAFLINLKNLRMESNQLLDHCKKVMFYGKKLNVEGLEISLFDIAMQLYRLANYTGKKMGDILEVNIAKLKVRYPEKFTNEKAENRDLKTERKTLEEGR